MSNSYLAAGDERKQRAYLGAGDPTTEGSRQTFGFNLGTIARVAQIIVAGGVTAGAAVLGGGLGGISPRDPTTDPGIIVH